MFLYRQSLFLFMFTAIIIFNSCGNITPDNLTAGSAAKITEVAYKSSVYDAIGISQININGVVHEGTRSCFPDGRTVTDIDDNTIKVDFQSCTDLVVWCMSGFKSVNIDGILKLEITDDTYEITGILKFSGELIQYLNIKNTDNETLGSVNCEYGLTYETDTALLTGKICGADLYDIEQESTVCPSG